MNIAMAGPKRGCEMINKSQLLECCEYGLAALKSIVFYRDRAMGNDR